MPRMRRRLGHGGFGEGLPRRIYGFVMPCILLLLHRNPSHGYKLIEDMVEFGFDKVPMDPSVIYRYLRDMELNGLIVSNWETESGGPPKRVYQITGAGDAFLRKWVNDLKETRITLDNFIKTYEDHMMEPESMTKEARSFTKREGGD